MPLSVTRTTAYGWLMLAGVLFSLAFWWRQARRDERLLVIYLVGLGGAFVGAKLVYLAAEGWLHWHDPNRWVIGATGKSITGALLGGYAGVEWAKRLMRYDRATGDRFALLAPAGIAIGRIGCVLHGCCLGRECGPIWMRVADPAGVERWPAAWVELGFNLGALAIILVLRRCRLLADQHFHLYLVAYGIFRFTHEFMRDTPRLLGPLTGYQLASLAVAALGALGFIRRRQARRRRPTRPPEVPISTI